LEVPLILGLSNKSNIFFHKELTKNILERIMKHFFVLLAVIVFFSCSTNERFDFFIGQDLPDKQFNSEYGFPLIYLADTFSINSAKYANRYLENNMPKFVLYENGQLIYGVVENDKVIYYKITLSNEEMSNLFEELEIPKNKYFDKNNINAVSTWITDQPGTVLIINANYQKIITMYGSLGQMDDNKKKYHKKLLTIYNNIINYRNENAEVWMPDFIEVILWEYKGDRIQNTNEWPDIFPNLDSSNTIKLNESSYMLFINRDLYDEFMDYGIKISEQSNKHINFETIMINGKNMTFGYKFPLPNIKYWRIIH
jgi:hypothetical protein